MTSWRLTIPQIIEQTPQLRILRAVESITGVKCAYVLGDNHAVNVEARTLTAGALFHLFGCSMTEIWSIISQRKMKPHASAGDALDRFHNLDVTEQIAFLLEVRKRASLMYDPQPPCCESVAVATTDRAKATGRSGTFRQAARGLLISKPAPKDSANVQQPIARARRTSSRS